MTTIGLTGGIGVGKTYIAARFAMMGIPIYNADEEAKKLYTQKEVIEALFQKYGTEVVEDGKVNFQKLAKLIFENEDDKQFVNHLIHPLVMKNFQKWKEKQTATTVMMESALIFEAQLFPFFDKIVVIDAPKELRISRIMKRNPGLSRDEILQIIDNQIDQEEKCRRADWVIKNY